MVLEVLSSPILKERESYSEKNRENMIIITFLQLFGNLTYLAHLYIYMHIYKI